MTVGEHQIFSHYRAENETAEEENTDIPIVSIIVQNLRDHSLAIVVVVSGLSDVRKRIELVSDRLHPTVTFYNTVYRCHNGSLGLQ